MRHEGDVPLYEDRGTLLDKAPSCESFGASFVLTGADFFSTAASPELELEGMLFLSPEVLAGGFSTHSGVLADLVVRLELGGGEVSSGRGGRALSGASRLLM